MWPELLLYIVVYLLIGLIYRFALPVQYQDIATKIIQYLNGFHEGKDNFVSQHVVQI